MLTGKFRIDKDMLLTIKLTPDAGGDLSHEPFEEKFNSLTNLIKEFIVIEVKLAQETLLEEIQKGEGHTTGSYWFAEKSNDFLELLQSTKEPCENYIPPRMDYLEACIRELLVTKKNFTCCDLKNMYLKKYPRESVGRYMFYAGTMGI